ncbi:MAG: 50S ribosomal protein L5 [Candidatus Nealsonbacteria bacterium]
MIIPLVEKYKKEAVPKMKEKFGYKSNMAVPRLLKVVINTGFGREVAGKSGEDQKKIADSVLEDISIIAGQKPVKTLAKKAIASFKVREGMVLGVKVTLRGKKMIDFLERLINLVLPRTRDFKGISPDSVDGNGNLTMAVKEQIAFPEILPEKIRRIFGLEITVATTAKTKKEGAELFKLLGFPLRVK